MPVFDSYEPGLAAEVTFFESIYTNLIGLQTYVRGPYGAEDAERERDNMPYDPSLTGYTLSEQKITHLAYQHAGGNQPGVEYSIPEDTPESIKKPWFEVSLVNPFRLAFHGLKVPVLGVMSIIIERTKTIGIVVYSLLYMSLPTLVWFLGVDASQFFTMRYAAYRPPPPGFGDPQVCPDCNQWNSKDPAFTPALAAVNWHLVCQCQAALLRDDRVLKSLAADDDEVFVDTCEYVDFAGLARLLSITELCDHPEGPAGHSGIVMVPRPTLDGLYAHGPLEEWKAHQHQGGLRCSTHFPSTMHGVHPVLVKNWTEGKFKAPEKFKVVWFSVLARWRQFMAAYPAGSTVSLTGMSIDRLPHSTPIEGALIVLYVEPGLPAALGRQWGRSRLNQTRFFRLPPFGANLRLLGNARVVLAYLNNAPVRLIVRNQSTVDRERVYIDHLQTSPYHSASGSTGHTHAAHAGALLVAGRCGLHSPDQVLDSFYLGALVYGWDEIYPAYCQKNLCTVYRRLSQPALMLGITRHSVVGPTTGLMISGEVEHEDRVFVIQWTRQAIYWVNRMTGVDIDSGRMTFWHVWADPRPVYQQGTEAVKGAAPILKKRVWFNMHLNPPFIPPVKRVTAPGDHILQELVAALGGVRLFVLGTRGDIVPFEALGRHIASYGVPVDLYVLNTEEEGKILLKSALGKDVPPGVAVGVFNRARTLALEGLNAASLTHSALMLGDIPSLDLTPPSELVLPKTIAGGWLMSLGSAILGALYASTARIGPYVGPRVLPTSPDGKHFLEARQNTRKNPIGAVWGTDNEPAPGFEHIPIIPPGNHQEIFRHYREIVCHGGAGTVSTASACGAKVIVPVGGLDRARRNPYDAGMGLVPGADPDNVFLALADSDIRFLAFWLRRNWTKPWKLWLWYGFPGLGWLIFRFLMLYTLYNKSFKTVPVSSEPLTVLAGILGMNLNKWYLYTAALIATKVADSALDYLNVSYMRVLSEFARYNWRLAVSPVALYIASVYNIGYGLFYACVSPWAYRTVSHFTQMWSNQLLGVYRPLDKDGKRQPTVYMEFSQRWLGWIPIIHTALVVPELNLRLEGKSVMSLYTYTLSPGPTTSVVLLPTFLTLEDLRAVPMLSGYYNLSWNCYTTIAIAFRGRLVSLGVGGLYVYPFAVVVSCIYTVNAIAATTLWGIAQLLPTHIDPTISRPASMDIAADMLALLWNRVSATGEWDPILVLDWWRQLLTVV